MRERDRNNYFCQRLNGTDSTRRAPSRDRQRRRLSGGPCILCLAATNVAADGNSPLPRPSDLARSGTGVVPLHAEAVPPTRGRSGSCCLRGAGSDQHRSGVPPADARRLRLSVVSPLSELLPQARHRLSRLSSCTLPHSSPKQKTGRQGTARTAHKRRRGARRWPVTRGPEQRKRGCTARRTHGRRGQARGEPAVPPPVLLGADLTFSTFLSQPPVARPTVKR
jgi:hypothetical protein